MITTKTCSTCEHFPNDHHCIGCKWDESKVLDKLRAELHANAEMHDDGDYYLRDEWIDEIFDKYRNEVNP